MEFKKDAKVRISGAQGYQEGTIGIIVGEAPCPFWFYVKVCNRTNSIHMSHLEIVE